MTLIILPSNESLHQTRGETLPGLFNVPYLLIEMPGGLGEATYFPDPEKRFYSYRVVFDTVLDLFARDLADFVA